MKISDDDEYEEMAMDYQCLEMNRLNDLLKKFGIEDKSVRKSICSEYAFDSGYFLDAGWFQREGRRLFPQICFAERRQDPDANLGSIQTLYVPSPGCDLHESAFGNSEWFFDEQQENISEIATGSYQQQDELEQRD